jgi:hypothetical protein
MVLLPRFTDVTERIEHRRETLEVIPNAPKATRLRKMIPSGLLMRATAKTAQTTAGYTRDQWERSKVS